MSQICMFIMNYLLLIRTISCISAGYCSSETENRLGNQLNTFSNQCHVSPALCTLLISKSMFGVSGV